MSPFRCSNTSIAFPASVKKLSKNAVKTSPTGDSKHAVKTSVTRDSKKFLKTLPSRDSKVPSSKPKYVKGIQSSFTRVFVTGLPNTGKTTFTAAANFAAPPHIQFFDVPDQAFQARIDLVIVMVDANSVDSIRLAPVVKRQLEGFLEDNPGFILVGNKVDTITDKHNGFRAGAELFTTFKKSRFAKWFATSAKDRTNIGDIISYLSYYHIAKHKLIAQGMFTSTPPPESESPLTFATRLPRRVCRSPWTPSPPKRSRRKISRSRFVYPHVSPATPSIRDPVARPVRKRLSPQFELWGEA
eukprot:1323819-Amorphochlora_amoeboformis.AAC.2